MAFQQESIGPGLQTLVAAGEMDQPQPQDRINIPTSGRVKGSMETEACQFPPSHTPQSEPSPVLPPYSAHAQLPPQLSTHGQYRGPMDYYQASPPSYYQRPPVPRPQYVPGHPQRYPPQPQTGPATRYFYPPAQTYQPIPHRQQGPYAPAQPAPHRQQGPYAPAQPAPHRQQGPYAPAQPAPHRQQGPYAPAQPAPHRQQGPYAPAQPAPHRQQGPYAPAQPAPHRQQGPYAPAQPAPHRQQGPYARVHAPAQEQEQNVQPGPELANDPLYQCIRSQMMGQSQKDCCKGCFPTGLARMSTLSYKMKEVITFLIPKRRGTPAESPLLKKAFITGWVMLSSYMFPLVSRHGLRCLWSCGQMVFSIALIVMSFSVSTQYENLQNRENTQPYHSLARNWFAISATILTILDSVVCLVVLGKTLCGRQNLEQERQPLLHNNNNSKRFFVFFTRYNDVLRLVITEILLYGILICSLPVSFHELHGKPSHENSSAVIDNHTVVLFANTETLAHLKFSMFILTAITFAIFVYLPQFLVLGKIFLLRNQLRPKSPTRRIAGWWFVQLLLQFIGQKVVQIVMLTTFVTAQMNSHLYTIKPDLVYFIVIAYFAPVVGILTFLIVGYGWLEDLSMLHCTDYLSKLDQIRSDAQTPLTTKQAIEEVLAHFEFRNLLGGLGQITLDHFFRNCKYILQSPLAFLLSLPNIAVIVLYLYALYHYATMLALAWLVIQPFLILFVNLYTFCVSLILVVYLIFLPLAGPVIFWRICKRVMDQY